MGIEHHQRLFSLPNARQRGHEPTILETDEQAADRSLVAHHIMRNMRYSPSRRERNVIGCRDGFSARNGQISQPRG